MHSLERHLLLQIKLIKFSIFEIYLTYKYINYQIVFDLASYGVSANMPESVYHENKELIQQLLQSIVIKDSISE